MPVAAVAAQQTRCADRERQQKRQRRLHQHEYRKECPAAIRPYLAQKIGIIAGTRQIGELYDPFGKAPDTVERVALAAVNRPDHCEKSRGPEKQTRPSSKQADWAPAPALDNPAIQQHCAARRGKKQEGGQLCSDRECDRGPQAQTARRRRGLQPFDKGAKGQ